MSVEKSAGVSSESVESSHGGPGYPWETVLEVLGQVTRSELATALVERGVRPVAPAALDMIDGAISRGELLYDGQFVRSNSRQSNLNKSVNSSTGGISGSDVDGPTTEERIDEKVDEFVEEYPFLATLPIAESDGVSIRRDYANVEYESWVEDQPDTPQFEIENPAQGESVSDVSGVEWREAVRTLLESYGRTKKTTINLQKGVRSDPEFNEFSVSAENRWFASYQKRYFAQLDAWLRELCGGERPSGGETAPEFDDPHVVLLTRSASSVPGDGERDVRSRCQSCDTGFAASLVSEERGTVNCPDCDARASVVEEDHPRVGPVEHANTLRDSWEPVYHTLRNTLRSEGYELGESWQYDRRLEPHTGKRGSHGTNTCYTHEHVIVVVDGEVTSEDLRPVIEKHVEECEWAGSDAHGEEAIEVREPSELNDVAAYVADYCSIDPVELWDRDADYVAWAAAMTAANIRTVSRSEAAAAAAKADACKQRSESDESKQSVGHGENVVRSARVSHSVECAECGSPHGIDQDQTLTAHRLDTPEQPTIADGGVEVPDRVARLRERWPSAVGGATVGESPVRTRQREAVRGWIDTDMSLAEYWGSEVEDTPPPEDLDQMVAEVRSPDFDPMEPVGFDDGDERVPEWRVESVTVDGETHKASAGNGVEMVEVTDVHGRLERGLDIQQGQKYRCECGVGGYGTAIVSHLGSHGIDELEIARAVIAEE